MSTENLKSNQFQDAVNGSEISNYIEKSLDSFSTTKINEGYWKLYNKDNPSDDGDQAKAVFGICFTFAALFILGTYSCLL
tara:strand:+ start:402 stop:641 length:240 start_codon:yes stop_codon:yes gene_type:complete